MNRTATTAIARIPNARNGRLRRRPADRTLHRMTPADSTQAAARTASWSPSASTRETPSRRWVVTTPAMATPRTPRTNQVERGRAAWVDIIGPLCCLGGRLDSITCMASHRAITA
jgi:hypothetical protein